MIVKTMKLGAATVNIYDDCFCSQEEIKQRLDSCADILRPYVLSGSREEHTDEERKEII